MDSCCPLGVTILLGISALGCSILVPQPTSERTATPAPTVSWSAQTATPQLPSTRIPLPASDSRPSGEAGISGVVTVDNVRWHHVPYGGLVFMGLVKNTGSGELKSVEVVVLLDDASGRAVAAAFGYTELGLISPGEASPFRVVFLVLPPAWQDYRILIQGGKAEYVEKCRDFDILSQTIDRPDSETYEIKGEIKNTGGKTCAYILVCAAFYDAGGNLVGVDSTYARRERVRPGETSRYEILYYDTGLGEVDHFELWVEGDPED